MNKKLVRNLIIALLLTVVTASALQAQLVIVRKKMKVVKLDYDKRRIEITGVDDPMKTIGYVNVDGETKVTRNGRAFSWKKIKRGWIIGVKGGLRFDGHINANEIEILKTP